MTKIIVLDGGHGGKDAGAVKGKIYEKDLVMKLVKKAKSHLESTYDGHKVLLTRSGDTFVELSERAKFANRNKANAFVSFHINAGGGTGFETFKYPSAKGSLQDKVHGEIEKVLKKYNVKDRGKKSANLAVVRETKMEAVLTETLFIDKATDLELLQNSKFMDEIAIAHADGVAKYLGLKKKTKPKAKTINYKIKKGDTLWSIAHDPKHKTTVDAIYNANAGLKKKDVIYAGETIKIPIK
ncbi:N-acetylmuramoyl-L-alanine amidase [Bacillus phage SRT01hs]|uniref:N-acetylmuramoyl-L-alanine amidase n=1 Tax=Bacillus phage SRT01hs TaxID=2847044 RepID=A0A6B9SZH0_9CAUD|nr:endolysin [Bacillus phage SRT01hs]QHJ75885.1 N-acetylmuramoyl-L-alanine amidase [Bacillus phage SRT01hs]